MPATPETKALLEHAVDHVLEQQQMVLKHKSCTKLLEIARQLGELVARTWVCLGQGLHKLGSTSHLTQQARQIERATDKISEELWVPVLVDISCIYERIEQTFVLTAAQRHLQLGMALNIRNHFHNVRILLLEQLLGARMLINNNDLGTESERIWQQFFERQLGPSFRVLQGGHIFDHNGKHSAQIDLIVVGTDAQIITPGHSEDGKANVLVDQVIAAIMVASTIDVDKFKKDWFKLSEVAGFYSPEADFPNARNQRWPLCYMVAGKSVPLPALEKAWRSCVGAKRDGDAFGPQLVMALDTGFAYSGATVWPCPKKAYIHPDEVCIWLEEGIYAGLGLAWILSQIRMRARVINGRPVHDVMKFGKLLDEGSLKSLPATFSMRFYYPLRVSEIGGCLRWGGKRRRPHNRLEAYSLERRFLQNQTSGEFDVLRAGDTGWQPSHLRSSEEHRWFDRNFSTVGGDFIILKERFGPELKEWQFVIFDSRDGSEIVAGDFFTRWTFEDWRKGLEERFAQGGAESSGTQDA